MDLLFILTKWSGMLLLAGFTGVVVWKMLTGEIALDGLLDSVDRQGNRTQSPARVQLLIITLAVAAKYVLSVIQHSGENALPTIPDELVVILGGSQVVYAGGKAWTAFLPLLKKMK